MLQSQIALNRRQAITWTNHDLLSTGALEQVSMRFQLKYKGFRFRKCIWKYHPQNGGNYVSVSLCLIIRTKIYSTPNAAFCVTMHVSNLYNKYNTGIWDNHIHWRNLWFQLLVEYLSVLQLLYIKSRNLHWYRSDDIIKSVVLMRGNFGYIFHYMQHRVLLRRGGDTDRVIFEGFAHKKVVYVSATTFQNGAEWVVMSSGQPKMNRVSVYWCAALAQYMACCSGPCQEWAWLKAG